MSFGEPDLRNFSCPAAGGSCNCTGACMGLNTWGTGIYDTSQYTSNFGYCPTCGQYHSYAAPCSPRGSMVFIDSQIPYPFGWQFCPVCRGTGQDPSVTLSCSTNNPCTVCKGKKIINVLNGKPPEG